MLKCLYSKDLHESLRLVYVYDSKHCRYFYQSNLNSHSSGNLIPVGTSIQMHTSTSCETAIMVNVIKLDPR